MSHLYWNVEYDYAVNSQLPRPDLHRQDTQPYGLRPKEDALKLLDKTIALIRRNRDAHETLGRQFSELWLNESKPYALDAVSGRYQQTVRWYEDLGKKVADARQQLEAGKPLPDAVDIGLAIPSATGRRTQPTRIDPTPLAADAPWAEPTATHRLGILVCAGPVDRHDLPIEVDVNLPAAFNFSPFSFSNSNCLISHRCTTRPLSMIRAGKSIVSF